MKTSAALNAGGKKMARIILFIVFFALLASILYLFVFDYRVTYYTYNGVTITRIDDANGGYYLIYGRCNYFNKSKFAEYISGSSWGLDGFMDAYLIFLPDKRVKILRCEGLSDYILKPYESQHLFLIDYGEPYKFDSLMNDAKKNKYGVINIISFLASEKEAHRLNPPNVKVEY